MNSAISVQTLGNELYAMGIESNLFVYDNSPDASPISSRSYRGWKTTYVHDHSNPGVSSAYNAGYNFAKKTEKKWMLLLDQDTEFASGCWSIYADAVAEHPHCKIFAPILKDGNCVCSPCRISAGRGRPASVSQLVPGPKLLSSISLLNSGMLISLQAFAAVGGYEIRAGLDYSDHIFIKKLSAYTDSYYLLNMECRHSISARDISARISRDRFMQFCSGAVEYAKLDNNILVFAYILLRSFKLALSARNIWYVKYCVKTIFR